MTELTDYLAEHIKAASMTLGMDPERAQRLADSVVSLLRRDFGGGRHYIGTAPDERRQEGERLLGMGHDCAEVARALKVHVSTVHRWRQTARKRNDPKPKPTGLARNRDWLL